MKGKAIRSTAIWLCAILTFTTLLVVLGRSDDRIFPSITSSKPSGTRLLSEILEVNGINVRQDRSRIPQAGAKDVVVAFVPLRGERPTWSDRPVFSTETTDSAIQGSLYDIAVRGGRVVVVYLNGSLRQGTLDASEPKQVMHLYQKASAPLKVSASVRYPENYFPNPEFEDGLKPASQIDVWQSQEIPLVTFRAFGKGTLVEVTDGIGFTNRFIDKYDNANFAVQLFAPLVPKGASLVFAEASFGNMSEDSLISAIGGWARASLWQGLLLLGVIGWSLGTMFGLPTRSRLRQAGTRDLMEAFAHLLRRGKKRQIAVENVMGALEREVRLSVGLPVSASKKQVRNRVTSSIASDLDRLRHQNAPAINDIEALRSKLREVPRTKSRRSHEVD